MRARLLIVAMLAFVTAGCSMLGAGAQEEVIANEADARFSLEMIPHHRQTLEISALVPQRSTDPFVTGLADEISDAEASEIEQMAGYLRSWNITVPGDEAHLSHNMPGMLTDKDIDNLKAANGKQFDALFLTTLSKHLRSGVQMAKNAQASGQHVQTRALAGKIVTSQSEVVDEIAKRAKP